MRQFLLGTVQQQSFPTIINIVLYFFKNSTIFLPKSPSTFKTSKYKDLLVLKRKEKCRLEQKNAEILQKKTVDRE